MNDWYCYRGLTRWRCEPTVVHCDAIAASTPLRPAPPRLCCRCCCAELAELLLKCCQLMTMRRRSHASPAPRRDGAMGTRRRVLYVKAAAVRRRSAGALPASAQRGRQRGETESPRPSRRRCDTDVFSAIGFPKGRLDWDGFGNVN